MDRPANVPILSLDTFNIVVAIFEFAIMLAVPEKVLEIPSTVPEEEMRK